MAAPKVSEAEFIALWERLGTPSAVAEATGTTLRNVHGRRSRLAAKGIRLETRSPGAKPEWADKGWTYPREIREEVHDGVVVVSSDHHYQPDYVSVAHKALLEVIRLTKPCIKVLNGDVFDGGSVGRHPPFGWATKPKVKDELHAAQERVGEIELALPRGCKRVFTVGNHDLRFERNLATAVPEYEGLVGMRLSDHFDWDMAWSLMLNAENPHPVMIKHRHAGGIHSGYNNALRAGISMVTGHTHLLSVTPWGDYRGRRYGVSCGTLQDLDRSCFEYGENGPSAACSGFAVLTFREGQLLPPELCTVIDGKAWFRGEVVA